ncbi:MAG: DNA-directed RNA polymerase subunit omega [Clostridia bacterium]|nr:DNA-directed RNA polymerase subunit omega [Clostridia bacterium]
MMIKPSIEELTNQNNCNRYTLVIASAKSARYVTAKQKLIKDAEKSELADSSYLQGSDKQPLRRDLIEEKPVSAGIELIHDGDFHIVDPTVGITPDETK